LKFGLDLNLTTSRPSSILRAVPRATRDEYIHSKNIYQHMKVKMDKKS
jgi:hypothetical protein